MTTFLKSIIVITIAIVSPLLHAQEGVPIYQDYLTDNYFLIFPAMAGAGYGGKARLTARQQWLGESAAPNLQTASIHARIGERSPSGLGLVIFNDANGYHTQSGAKGTYAHHLSFSKDPSRPDQLSFGLSVGFTQSRLDTSEFNQELFALDVVSDLDDRVTYLNIDIGTTYFFYEFYAHVAAKNLLGESRDLYTSVESSNLRSYLGMIGYNFGGNNGFGLEPSVMYQYVQQTEENLIDVNGKFYKDFENDRTLWGGLQYRRSFDGAQFINDSGAIETQKLQVISPFLGMDFGQYTVAYTYSSQFGDVRYSNLGHHQITLGYNFLKDHEPKPCRCPAFNY